MHGEIEKKSNVLNLQPNLTNVAQRFEGKYNINYFLDIIQQDQHVYEQYIPYAADHVLRKPKMHWDKLVAQINFYFDFGEQPTEEQPVEKKEKKTASVVKDEKKEDKVEAKKEKKDKKEKKKDKKAKKEVSEDEEEAVVIEEKV